MPLVSLGTCLYCIDWNERKFKYRSSQPIERDPVKRSCSRVSANGPVKELKHTFIRWHLTEAPTRSCFHLGENKPVSEILLEFAKCLNIRGPEWKQHRLIGFPFRLLTYWIPKSSQVKGQQRKNGHHLQKTQNLEVWRNSVTGKSVRFPSAIIEVRKFIITKPERELCGDFQGG